MKRVMQS